VYASLRLGHGVSVGHGAVEMLMQRAGVAGAAGRPKWKRTKPDSVAADHVERQFARSAPNQLWVDVAEPPTREGREPDPVARTPDL
jgi:putative transposase